MKTVNSLAIIDTTVIASVGSGDFFYYKGLADTPFVSVQDAPQRYSPILCFTMHNVKLFAGNSIGDIFFSNFDGSHWDVITTSLTYHALHSLALNNSYMFAGTESGVWRLDILK